MIKLLSRQRYRENAHKTRAAHWGHKANLSLLYLKNPEVTPLRIKSGVPIDNGSRNAPKRKTICFCNRRENRDLGTKTPLFLLHKLRLQFRIFQELVRRYQAREIPVGFPVHIDIVARGVGGEEHGASPSTTTFHVSRFKMARTIMCTRQKRGETENKNLRRSLGKMVSERHVAVTT